MSNTLTPVSINADYPDWGNYVATTEYVGFVGGEANSGMRKTIVVEGVSYVQYRIQSLLFSCFALSIGLIDILLFVSKNVYFLHPSFDLLLLVGGFFLLLTTILAIKGK